MDDTKMPDAGSGQSGQPAKLDISVKVFPIQPKEGSNLRAFASITLGGVFAVNDLRIVEGSKGTFVSMPQTKGKGKDNEDKYFDVCFPITKEFRKELSDAVLSKYAQVKNLAVENAAERPSVRRNLQQKKAEAVEKTTAQPTPAPKKKAELGER